MKPFNIKLAKAGHPVCTRDGKPVRILGYDRVSAENYCIVALIKVSDNFEDIKSYPTDGHYYGGKEHNYDLMMVPEKHEGWVNVYSFDKKHYSADSIIHSSKEDAISFSLGNDRLISTVKIEWEE